MVNKRKGCFEISTININKKSLIKLKYFHFFLYGAIAILISYFPLYFESSGLSKVQIGLLMAGGPFISLVANPFWGYWSDRLQNIRRIIIIILIGNLLATQVVFQISGYLFIYAIMIVFFFFQTPLFSQSNSLILNTIEGTKHKFGSFRMWGSLGWALMAVAAGPVIGWLGIGKLWIVYSIMLIIAMLFTIGLPKGESGEKSIPNLTSYRKAMFSNKIFLIFLLLSIFISIPNSINQTFITLYISNLGGNEVLIGWSVFLSAIFEVPVFLLLDRFMKNKMITMVKSLIIISIMFLLRWILMASATDAIYLVLIQMMHCITFGGFYYIGTNLTSFLIPKELRATGQAVYAITWVGISGITAGILGGWLYENFGPRIMYSVGIIFTIFGLMGFIILLLWIKKKSQEKKVLY